MNITVYQLMALLGLPSAVTGFAVWYLKRLLEKREKRMDERERAHTELEYAIVESINASLSLGEATANAVAGMPAARCDETMYRAVDYAREVKRRQKELLTRMGIASLYDGG